MNAGPATVNAIMPVGWPPLSQTLPNTSRSFPELVEWADRIITG